MSIHADAVTAAPALGGQAWQSGRVTVTGSALPAAQGALLNLLLPVWQLAIGLCVLAAVVVGAVRLARRGPSRVTTALLLTGGAVAAICVFGVLIARL